MTRMTRINLPSREGEGGVSEGINMSESIDLMYLTHPCPSQEGNMKRLRTVSSPSREGEGGVSESINMSENIDFMYLTHPCPSQEGKSVECIINHKS